MGFILKNKTPTFLYTDFSLHWWPLQVRRTLLICPEGLQRQLSRVSDLGIIVFLPGETQDLNPRILYMQNTCSRLSYSLQCIKMDMFFDSLSTKWLSVGAHASVLKVFRTGLATCHMNGSKGEWEDTPLATQLSPSISGAHPSLDGPMACLRFRTAFPF